LQKAKLRCYATVFRGVMFSIAAKPCSCARNYVQNVFNEINWIDVIMVSSRWSWVRYILNYHFLESSANRRCCLPP